MTSFPDPWQHLTALKSLTLLIDVCGPTFPLTQQLTAMTRLTHLSLDASDDGDPHRITVDVPQLPSVRHLTLGGYLDSDLSTLTKFCKRETLHLDCCHCPDPTSFSSWSHCQHVIILSYIFPEPGLRGWISLFEAVLQLPALHHLFVRSHNLTQLTDQHWIFQPGPEVPIGEAEPGGEAEPCQARLSNLERMIRLAAEIGRLHELPDGIDLKQLCILDLNDL